MEQKVRVAHREKGAVEVDAKVKACWCIHQSLDGNGQWTLTHVPSGTRVTSYANEWRALHALHWMAKYYPALWDDRPFGDQSPPATDADKAAGREAWDGLREYMDTVPPPPTPEELERLQARVAELEGEMAALRQVLKSALWFTFDPEDGHEVHGSAADAAARAREILGDLANDGPDGTWHINTEDLHYGLLIPFADAMGQRYEVDGEKYLDFEMRDIEAVDVLRRLLAD